MQESRDAGMQGAAGMQGCRDVGKQGCKEQQGCREQQAVLRPHAAVLPEEGPGAGTGTVLALLGAQWPHWGLGGPVKRFGGPTEGSVAGQHCSPSAPICRDATPGAVSPGGAAVARREQGLAGCWGRSLVTAPRAAE